MRKFRRNGPLRCRCLRPLADHASDASYAATDARQPLLLFALPIRALPHPAASENAGIGATHRTVPAAERKPHVVEPHELRAHHHSQTSMHTRTASKPRVAALRAFTLAGIRQRARSQQIRPQLVEQRQQSSQIASVHASRTANDSTAVIALANPLTCDAREAEAVQTLQIRGVIKT